ncbi:MULTISPECIES: anthranilate synthase component I [Listeria]|uniref:anthranilate synthase component I n=1 Tax=Listeria TaxID=1637 RepID=UPI000B58AB64|nr:MULTISPECIES: anthranilate synthase component I [Listeria]
MQKTIEADTLTIPLIYKRLSGKNKSLLEGTAKDAEAGRYSIIAFNPVHEIQIFGNTFILDGIETLAEDPLEKLYEQIVFMEREKLPLPFEAGAIGYVGYDMVRLYENIGEPKCDDLNLPDAHFFLYDSYVIYDHKLERLTLVEDNAYSKREDTELQAALVDLEHEIFTPKKGEADPAQLESFAFKSRLEKAAFMEKVARAKAFIEAGDFFQVVLSQRLEAKFTGDAFSFYRKLRLLNPSPYLFFIDFGETKLIGSSPESLVSVNGDFVQTNPIAGTRKRGQSAAEDKMLAAELLADEKELAEHRMLVDLGRNDIGRVSAVGSVSVPIYLTIERYRFVMHLVSVVEGRLLPELHAFDALKSVLPAGTVSGAPKIRAMQRLYEWEDVKRGPYGGAVGYVTKRGNADFALAIRMAVIHKEHVYVQAGAGIVYDSDPESEYDETLQKAKALLEVGK